MVKEGGSGLRFVLGRRGPRLRHAPSSFLHGSMEQVPNSATPSGRGPALLVKPRLLTSMLTSRHGASTSHRPWSTSAVPPEASEFDGPL
jgi:hypothetical protein